MVVVVLDLWSMVLVLILCCSSLSYSLYKTKFYSLKLSSTFIWSGGHLGWLWWWTSIQICNSSDKFWRRVYWPDNWGGYYYLLPIRNIQWKRRFVNFLQALLPLPRHHHHQHHIHDQRFTTKHTSCGTPLLTLPLRSLSATILQSNLVNSGWWSWRVAVNHTIYNISAIL